MRSFIALLVTSLVSHAAATIYTTQPVSSSKCSATLVCKVDWQEDGVAPLLGQIGPVSIDLCSGSQFQQVCVQNISPSIDVSLSSSTTFRADPHIGPTGQWYFVKYTALNFADPPNPTVPFTAYSAKFSLVGMMGPFNRTFDAMQSGSPTGSTAVIKPSGLPAVSIRTTATGGSFGIAAATGSATDTGAPLAATNVVGNSAGSKIPATAVALGIASALTALSISF
ncbi:hypothetical protein FRB99_004808 [Tulasnella sp. 403]|nr:hypothetical protein FRB99_004808 [Tulasnella sp. 403]